MCYVGDFSELRESWRRSQLIVWPWSAGLTQQDLWEGAVGRGGAGLWPSITTSEQGDLQEGVSQFPPQRAQVRRK